MIRLIPRSLEWKSPKLYPLKSKVRKEYYKYSNLTNENYAFLKEHCQYGLQSGEYTALSQIFSPLGLLIGMKICKAVKLMGTFPDCVIGNGHFMNGYYTLFYKKRIAGLRATFELHFHKADLFLYQVSLYEEEDFSERSSSNLTEVLLGSPVASVTGSNKQNVNHYEDKSGQSICAIDDPFNTRFIVTNPNSSSLNQLIASKYKSDEPNYEKIYRQVFFKSP